MARPWLLAVQGLTSIFFLCLGGATEYRRPGPGRIIQTPHLGSLSAAQQVHISAVGTNEMRISWVTSDDLLARSVMEYGNVSGVYSASATGGQTSYWYFFYHSGQIHNVKIGPLQPDTVYYYRCGGGGDEFSFKTPPAALPLELAIVGDLGQTEWTASTLAHIGQSNYDMLLLPGDLSYADGQQPLWDSFGRLVQPYASTRPWMVVEGNHEIESLPFLGFISFIAYDHRWSMPYEESNSTSNLYYSFNAAGGVVHVIMLGSYADFDSDSAQYQWLVADLAKLDRKLTPWLFVLLHAPWYNTNTAHQGEGESMREAMESLLYAARVDAVFAGHVHAYERFTRIYNNEADSCGPVYITIGDGGNREGLALNYTTDNKDAHLSLFREASFGHGNLRVINSTAAHWTWHRNDDAESTVADEVWLESLSESGTCVGAKSASAAAAKDEL